MDIQLSQTPTNKHQKTHANQMIQIKYCSLPVCGPACVLLFSNYNNYDLLFPLVLSYLAKESLIQLGTVPAQLFYCYTEKFKLGSSLSHSAVFHLNNKCFVYKISSTSLVFHQRLWSESIFLGIFFLWFHDFDKWCSD